MRKVLLLACSALALVAGARSLDPDEAIARLRADMPRHAPGAGVRLELAYTAGSAQAPGLYVFNGADGYLVVSADDSAPALLGYSDDGTFDPAAMPESMRWWMEQYARQIEQGGSSPAMAPARANISPLVTAAWNQDDPYNLLCPEMNSERTVTGCAATAMAQVMYYHRWPLQATGSNTYTASMLGSRISLDFSTVSLDWDDMTPVYNASSSEASRQAVARLMYACGVSLNMNYSVASMGGSGASDIMLPKALTTYFGYDKASIGYMDRDYYNTAGWEDMIYTELIEARPVLYCGVSAAGGGHAFVCDGYADGYFHINWGWGGSSNGYFLLTALDPYTQGIGGSTGAFNFQQSAIVGIQPSKGSDMATAMIGVEGVFQTGKTSYGRNEDVQFLARNDDGSNALIHNISFAPVTFDIGVKLVPVDGGEPIFLKGSYYSNMQTNYGFYTYNISFGTVGAGEYLVTPAFFNRQTYQWQDVFTPYYSGSLTAAVDDESVVFTLTPGRPELTASLALATPVYNGRTFKLTGTVTSMTDYTVTVTAYVYNNANQRVALGSKQLLRLRGAEPLALEYISSLRVNAGMTYAVGQSYEMRLEDEAGNVIGEPVPFVLQANPGSATISVNSLTVATGATAPADDIHILGSVTCKSGLLAGALTVNLYDAEPGNWGRYISTFSTPMLFAQAGETVNVDFTVKFLDGEIGHLYMLAFVIGNPVTSYLPEFTLTEPSPTSENALTFSAVPLTESTPVNVVAQDENGDWHAREVRLVDGIVYHNPVDVIANTISYTRTFAHDGWAALYLPFSLTSEEWNPWAATVLEYDGDTEVGGETVLMYRRVDAAADLEANHPYIMAPAATGLSTLTVHNKILTATPTCDIRVAGANYSLFGIYDTKTDMATSRAYALSGGDFRRASSDAVTLRPFRVYMLAESISAVREAPTSISMVIDGGTTAIDSVSTDTPAPGVLYDLGGRRVVDPVPGIYILDGRKIMVK